MPIVSDPDAQRVRVAAFRPGSTLCRPGRLSSDAVFRPAPASADAALLDELAGSPNGLSPGAARAALSWRFSEATLDRMRTLAARHSAEELSEADAAEFDRLRRVGLLADVLHAKARRAMRTATAAAAPVEIAPPAAG